MNKENINKLKMSRNLCAGFTSLTLAAAFLTVLPVVDSAINLNMFSHTQVLAQRAADETRPPPATRQAQTLSQRVFRVIENVMELRDEKEDYAGALKALDEIKAMNDAGRLNDYEQFTMWLFYASIDQAQERYAEAVLSYEQILKLPNLTPDQREQALSIIGQLYYVLEDYRKAIDALKKYLEVAVDPSPDMYLRIGTAYYQLDEFQEAIPFVLRNMELELASGDLVPESTYGLLRALYLSVEDYPKAKQVLREMVVLFNKPEDWGFLASIHGQMEEFPQQLQTYYVANAMGYLESENQLMNLAFQLFNNDNPYGAAKLVADGIAAGVIKETESNLSFLSQSWQIAREDEKAIEPLIKAAEISEEDAGELYARLGRAYLNLSEFKKAADAFETALKEGKLDRPDQVRITQARALMDAKEFDKALTVLKEAAKDQRSKTLANTWIKVVESEKAREDSLQERRELYKGFF
ncbi:MAG: tetratricopeptide repeat protein [Pseudomonadales bacterium]|nr:tetratricopeptide repeat protein [Pseudomonadales bacterium]